MERKATVTIDVSDKLGEGASIEWKRLTYGERMAALDASRKAQEDGTFVEFLQKFFIEHLVSWSLGIDEVREVEGFQGLYDEEISVMFEIAGKAIAGRLVASPDEIKN